MQRRQNPWTNETGRILFAFFALLGAGAGAAAESSAVVFVGDQSNHVASGLRALDLPFQQVSEKDLIRGDVCLFDHRVLICGMDVRRSGLGSIRDAVGAFAEMGGVVLCFRASDPDPWVPSPLEKDRAYTLGEQVGQAVPDATGESWEGGDRVRHSLTYWTGLSQRAVTATRWKLTTGYRPNSRCGHERDPVRGEAG